MTILNIIYDTCDSRPEGRELLNSIKINIHDAKFRYNTCELFHKVVDIKFVDSHKLNEGYSLQEILDIGAGIVHDEIERFVLLKIQEYIQLNPIK